MKINKIPAIEVAPTALVCNRCYTQKRHVGASLCLSEWRLLSRATNFTQVRGNTISKVIGQKVPSPKCSGFRKALNLRGAHFLNQPRWQAGTLSQSRHLVDRGGDFTESAMGTWHLVTPGGPKGCHRHNPGKKHPPTQKCRQARAICTVPQPA